MLRTTLLKFPKTRQALHTTCHVREEWTKASLRRMKKVELTRLAKENNLNFSGTKNDIIIQLLTHQTAKIVGSSTPSIQTIKSIAEPETTEEDFEPDNAWMNAFEMKVAQRGSRKAMDNTNDHFTSTSKPHHYNDQIKPSILLQPTQDKPQPTSSASPVPIISSTTTSTNEPKNITAEDLEGMDPQWVEAFELKVGSRGARSQLTDTLSPSTSATMEPFDNIEFTSIEHNKEDKEHEKKEHTLKETPAEKKEHASKETIDEKKTEEHKEKEAKEDHKKEEPNVESQNKQQNVEKRSESHSTHHNESQYSNTASSENESDNSREKIINTAVGSSMFLWYYGEGLSKIWHFLTSSS